MKAEYRKGYLQRDSVEHEEYAGAQSIDARESRERDGAIDLLERILGRDNLNKAYKQVKSNHGAPGIDGMTVEAALPWLRENREELLQSIRDGSYKPSPVRRKKSPNRMEAVYESSAFLRWWIALFSKPSPSSCNRCSSRSFGMEVTATARGGALRRPFGE